MAGNPPGRFSPTQKRSIRELQDHWNRVEAENAMRQNSELVIAELFKSSPTGSFPQNQKGRTSGSRGFASSGGFRDSGDFRDSGNYSPDEFTFWDTVSVLISENAHMRIFELNVMVSHLGKRVAELESRLQEEKDERLSLADKLRNLELKIAQQDGSSESLREQSVEFLVKEMSSAELSCSEGAEQGRRVCPKPLIDNE